MQQSVRILAEALAGRAEQVCRAYLSSGRREGNFWLVGDMRNSPGRSLYVRLRAGRDGVGAVGKWTDAESGEHGDLLDILRASTSGETFGEAMEEARRFLRLGPSQPEAVRKPMARSGRDASQAARRLIDLSRPLRGSVAETYLTTRKLAEVPGVETLRFHPRCWYRPTADDACGTPPAHPAMIAAVTDCAGRIHGAHRTWLAPDGSAKAAVATPRRAMGCLLGHGVRFGSAGKVMIAGEGIETMLSVRAALPAIPVIAALSAAHLGALEIPPLVCTLYVARDPDRAGHRAFVRLRERAGRADITVLPLDPVAGDFNDDLRILGLAQLRANLTAQMRPDDHGAS